MAQVSTHVWGRQTQSLQHHNHGHQAPLWDPDGRDGSCSGRKDDPQIAAQSHVYASNLFGK